MKCRIMTFACAFGLLLAVAMVCASLAQSQGPQQATTTSPVQNVPYVAPSETYPKSPATGYPPAASANPPGGTGYPFISNAPYTPHRSDSIKP